MRLSSALGFSLHDLIHAQNATPIFYQGDRIALDDDTTEFIVIFTKTLKALGEYKQMNLIQSIGKDDDGYAPVDVIPVGNDQPCTFFRTKS